MKYNISLLFLSLFLISAKTLTMDGGMPANLTPEQAAQWRAQDARLSAASSRLQGLNSQARALSATLDAAAPAPSVALPKRTPAQEFASQDRAAAPTPNSFARRNNNAPYRMPEITSAHLLVAAGLAWTAG